MSNDKHPTPEDIAELLENIMPPEMSDAFAEYQKRRAAGDPNVSIQAFLTYKNAPNDACRDYFDHSGSHELDIVKQRGSILYNTGPTVSNEEARENFATVPAVADFQTEGSGLLTATQVQIMEDLAAQVDAGVKRVILDEEEVNLNALMDVMFGFSVLSRGLRHLLNTDEYVDLRDTAPESDEDGDEE